MNLDMYKMMTSDEILASGINKLSESEQQAILAWGLIFMTLNMMEE